MLDTVTAGTDWACKTDVSSGMSAGGSRRTLRTEVLGVAATSVPCGVQAQVDGQGEQQTECMPVCLRQSGHSRGTWRTRGRRDCRGHGG